MQLDNNLHEYSRQMNRHNEYERPDNEIVPLETDEPAPDDNLYQENDNIDIFTEIMRATPTYQNVTTISSILAPATEAEDSEFYNVDNFRMMSSRCAALQSICEKVSNRELLSNEEIRLTTYLSYKFGNIGIHILDNILKNQNNYNPKLALTMLAEFQEDKSKTFCDGFCEQKCWNLDVVGGETPTDLVITPIPKYNETTAQNIVLNYSHGRITYDLNAKTFYLYQNGVYRLVDEGYIAIFLQSLLALTFEPKEIKESSIQSLIKRLKACIDITSNEDLNSNKFILNVKNGLINIRTGEFFSHTLDYKSTIQLGVSFDPSATCPLYMEKLDEIFEGDKDKINYWLDIQAYCLLRDNSLQKFFVLYGTGRNGKGVLTGVLAEIIGKENCSFESFMDISNDKHYNTIRLCNKLVNFSNELSTKECETDIIKRLTGEDMISSRQIYKEGIVFQNYARLIVSTNILPRVSNLDHAYLERIEIIQLPKSFAGNPDRNLKAKLFKEAPGIFNLLLSRFPSMIKEDCSISFNTPETIKRAKTKFMCKMHSVTEFVEETGQVDLPDSETRAGILLSQAYSNYKMWTEYSGYHSVGKSAFSDLLETTYGIKKVQIPYVNLDSRNIIKGQIWLIGIQFKPECYITLTANFDKSGEPIKKMDGKKREESLKIPISPIVTDWPEKDVPTSTPESIAFNAPLIYDENGQLEAGSF